MGNQLGNKLWSGPAVRSYPAGCFRWPQKPWERSDWTAVFFCPGFRVY